MRATPIVRAVVIALTLIATFAIAFGQSRHTDAAASPDRDGILRGTIVAATANAIEVRNDAGEIRRIAIDPRTLVMSDDADFSAANLADIRLTAADLGAGDHVEVVVENARRAGIVTRLSPIDATATARVRRP